MVLLADRIKSIGKGNTYEKITCIVVPVLVLVLLTSCSSLETVTTNKSDENKENYSDILVQSPMTISNNNLFPVNGENQYLRIRMVKGKYYEDWNPGAYQGTLLEGYFIIELADENGKAIAKTDLSPIYEEPLIFNSPFDLQFDDYNADGDLDFTIGQYTSSNGKDYKLFTLRKSGKIEVLPIKDYSSLFISKTTGYYSTKLEKVDNLTFKIEYYDNIKGKNSEAVFKWDGKEFVRELG